MICQKLGSVGPVQQKIKLAPPNATFFACDLNLKYLMERLEHDTKLAAEWFENNYMKQNEDKCHFLVSGHRYETIWAQIGEGRIWKAQTIYFV